MSFLAKKKLKKLHCKHKIMTGDLSRTPTPLLEAHWAKTINPNHLAV